MTMRSTSPELLKLAELELNEVRDKKIEDIECIKEWLTKQSQFKGRTDNQWILTFLRGSKFSLERTKEKLTNFYKMRAVAPELLTNRDPFQPELQELLKIGLCIPLNKSSDPVAPRVVLIQNDDPKNTNITVVNMVKLILMTFDILTNEDDNFIISGHVVLQDFKGIGLHHALQFTPVIIKKLMTHLQRSYPSRPKEFYFVNTPAFLSNIFNVLKPFMLEKIQKRVKIYKGNYTTDMGNFIPKEILPTEYGGEGGSINNIIAQWKSKVESYREWFLEEEQYTWTGETDFKSPLRNEDFGLEGSFRKLDID